MGWTFAVAGLVVGGLAGAGLAVLSLRRVHARSAPAVPAAAPDRPAQIRDVGRRGLDALRVGVVVLGANDRPVLANPAAREMGLVRAGAPDPDREGPAMAAHPAVRSLAGQARRSGVPADVELELPRGNGRDPLGVHLRAVALDDMFTVIEAADVTESHRVARVRRDFVANVSHELKTPVGALQLLAEALLEATGTGEEGEQPPDPRAARRFAERIQHESARMGRLVTELIELSRLQGADPLPDPEPVSVDLMIAEVLDRMRTGANAKGIEIRCTGARGLTVYGNPAQLATALGNLVENAVAYSPDTSDPGNPVEVVIDPRAVDDDVEIAVIDQGIGIALSDIDRIFERFYRADKARSRATGGTGLGLAIVKHIATNHGGSVSVVSKLGAGSTFTLRLPARPVDAGAEAGVPAGVDAGVDGPYGEGPEWSSVAPSWRGGAP